MLLLFLHWCVQLNSLVRMLESTHAKSPVVRTCPRASFVKRHLQRDHMESASKYKTCKTNNTHGVQSRQSQVLRFGLGGMREALTITNDYGLPDSTPTSQPYDLAWRNVRSSLNKRQSVIAQQIHINYTKLYKHDTLAFFPLISHMTPATKKDYQVYGRWQLFLTLSQPDGSPWTVH